MAIYDQLYALGDRERGRLRHGHLMTRFTADLTAIRNWVARGLAAWVTGGAMLVGLVAFLTWQAVAFGIAIAGLVGLLAVVTFTVGPVLGARIREARRRRARLSAFMGERLTAMQGVRAVRIGARDRRRLERLSRRLGTALVSREAWSGFVRALPLAAGLLAPALAIASIAVTPGATPSITEMVLVMTVASLVTRPLGQLAQAFVHRSNYRIARRMLRPLFELPTQPTRRSGGRTLRQGASRLDIRRLDMPAGTRRWSAAMCGGGRIIVSGPPGSGKTRLLRRLAGFERVRRRRVVLNGRDVATIARESLHREVRLLSPGAPLLRGSLARNVGLNGDQARRELLPLLRRCGIVPDQVDESDVERFRIAESGANVGDTLHLRLLLARALAGRPGLLLIDNLDQIHDQVVRSQIEALWSNAPGLSMIMVTEGRSWQASADAVWRLEDASPDARDNRTEGSDAKPVDEAA
jgi:ABC-type multidrug transport system fused ATPase/permease subunit